MRLLYWTEDGPRLTKDLLPHENTHKYAILSHTWGPDTDEVTYRDVEDRVGRDKVGYKKLEFCADQAKRDGLTHFWVDTCCINKTNQVELQEAITSMFRWYKDAARCYVYMPDISVAKYKDSQQFELEWEAAFLNNRWFKRGWTLQELVAPASVEFFTKEGRRLGDRTTLQQQIHDITAIPVAVLQGGIDLFSFDVDERFRWAETRNTTRPEDWAYCLLGIFGVSMTVIYGEGKANAVRRLKAEVADSMRRDDVLRRQVENRVWTVPFERNAAFTGRSSEIKEIRQQLFTRDQTARVAITGLGGIGKTQLVTELLYRLRDEYKDCSFLWIPATSEESLSQAYRKAAQELGIAGWDDKTADVKKLVQDHLSDERNGRSILVFDNFDDISLWANRLAQESASTSTHHRLRDYLPKGSHVSILFTTRDTKLAVQLAGQHIVKISEVSEADGKELLRKYLYDQSLLNNEDDTVALLKWLTYLPLAIVQASMYINQNSTDLRSYLSLLDEQEEDVVELLSDDFEDRGRYPDGKNPIAATWLVSFAQIQKRDPLAADYLSFMACIDTKDIPQSVLLPGQSRKKEADAIGTLQGYSFISQNTLTASFNTHRLVHLATRNWLREEGLLPQWSHRVVERLAVLFMNPGDYNRALWRSLMPHAFFVLGSRFTIKDNFYRLSLLMGYGICLVLDGRYPEAEPQFKQAMEIRKTKLGADHPSTLTSMALLASSIEMQGRWEEAEKLEMQLVEIRKTQVGADHPDTLANISLLASTLENQGRWKEAENLQLQLVETRKMKHGADDPLTLRSMANLASTLQSQGRWGEAETLKVQVMEIRKAKLGDDHPDTLASTLNLATTLRSQGRWEEAEKLLIHVVNTEKTRLGEDHPDTLTSIANLAATFSQQGRWEEAEKLEVQVMETFKTKFGADYPDTLNGMANLAVTFGQQRRWEEAEKLLVQVVETRKTKLGAAHPDTLISISNLAAVYSGQRRWEEAEKLQVQVLETRRMKFGADHPSTLTSMANLACSIGDQGRWEEGEKMHVQVLEARRTKLGADHPDVLMTMANLASTRNSQNRHVEAAILMESCIEKSQQALGPTHPYTVRFMKVLDKWKKARAV